MSIKNNIFTYNNNAYCKFEEESRIKYFVMKYLYKSIQNKNIPWGGGYYIVVVYTTIVVLYNALTSIFLF